VRNGGGMEEVGKIEKKRAKDLSRNGETEGSKKLNV